jgi:putative transposase
MSISEPNHVWASDISHIQMALGFLIDWASRAVLAWLLWKTMGRGFCIAVLDKALARDGALNSTTIRAQFTSAPSPACSRLQVSRFRRSDASFHG